jgi:hypothetical protein
MDNNSCFSYWHWWTQLKNPALYYFEASEHEDIGAGLRNVYSHMNEVRVMFYNGCYAQTFDCILAHCDFSHCCSDYDR